MPKLPQGSPFMFDPKASAASSITGTLYSLAIKMISFILAGIPYKWTGIMALGNWPFCLASSNAAFNNAGSIFQVSLSESIKIGIAPW